jgi:ABC-type transport system involved in multi-copper enzyme maturation permease subunit
VFPSAIDAWLQRADLGDEGRVFLQGAITWGLDISDGVPGLLLGFWRVMVLLAAAVCLATRFPFAANIISCAVFFVLGHLSSILVQSANFRNLQSGGTAVTRMLLFTAHAFNWLLPDLQLFSPTHITDVPIPVGQLILYSGEVGLYAFLYTGILLLAGLILFEDRDLA